MSIDVGLKLKYQDLQRALEMAEQLDALLANLSKGYNIKLNQSGIRGAQSQLSALEQSAKRVESAFSTMSKTLSMAGRGLQGLGNAFGGRVVNTMKTMATAFGTMGLYSAAQGTVQRYDTMRMFPRQMKLLGFNADQSAKAVDKLEQSVIGLPTGLDEIVESARQLVTLTGDLEKGSNLAIAANNALLAGGGDAQQRTWGQRQIRDLLSAGRLRSQEWESLIKALGPGLKDIGEAMGYADYGKFRTELKANKVVAEDFLDALVRVGTGEGVLAQRADLYKDTLSATAKNIKNSIQKLGAAGLDKLGEVLKEKTGKDLPQTIVSISDAIKQKLVPALEGWISANGDKIVAFFDKLKNYDWIGLVSKVGKGLAQYYNIIVGFFTKVPSGIIAFLSVWAGPIGRLLQTASVVVNGVGGIVGKLIRIFGKGGGEAINAASAGVSRFSNFAGSLKNAFAGLGLAAGFTAEVALVGGVIYEYAKIIESISNMKFGPNFGKNIALISKTAGVASGITGALTAIFGGLSKIPGVDVALVGGELLTGGFYMLIDYVATIIQRYADTAKNISEMKIPSTRRLSDVGTLIKDMGGLLDNAKVIPNKKVTSLKRLSEAMDYVSEIAQGLQRVKSVGQIGNVKNRLIAIMEAANVILDEGYDRGTKKKSKQASETLKNLASSTKSIGDTVNTLWDIRKKLVRFMKKGSDGTLSAPIADRVSTIVDDLFTGFDEAKLQLKTKERKEQASNAKSLSKISTNVADTVNSIWEIRRKLVRFMKKGEGGELSAPIAGRISTVVSDLLTAFDESKLGLKTSERQRQLSNAERLSKTITSIATIVESLYGVRKKLAKLVPNFGISRKASLTPMDNLSSRISEMIEDLNRTMKAISDEDVDVSGDAEEKIKAISNVITLIPNIIKNIQSISKPMSKLGIADGEWTLGDNLKTMMSKLTRAFSGTSAEDFSSLGENTSNLLTAVQNIRKAMSYLAKMQTIVSENFTFADGKWTLGEKLGQIMSGLSGAFGPGAALANGGAVDLSTVAPNLEAIAGQLKAIASNAKSAASNLTSAANAMSKLGEAASKHTGAIKNAASAASALKNGVNGIAGKAAGAAGGVALLGWSAGNQIEKLRSAASAASNLASAINSIPTNKTVNVQTNTGGGGLWNSIKNIFTGHKATGGMIHGPGGIDNVPTWLTAGEFVMRKSAVNKFGAGFMSRINNMDIDGAIRALSIRAGAGVFSKGGVVTNNYSRDNHANVTFNIGKASQGYSQRRANRWARALS